MVGYAGQLTAETADVTADFRPPLVATIAGFVLLASGVFVAAAGAQLGVFVTFASWWMAPIPYVLGCMGVLAMVTGGLTTKARFWAALAGTAVAFGMAVAVSTWTVYSLFNGMLSALGILAMPFALASALLMPLCVLPVLRTDRARRALYG